MNASRFRLFTLFIAASAMAHPLVEGASPEFRELVAVPAQSPPLVDGRDGDPAWDAAVALTVEDAVAGVPITLKAVYTDDTVFWLATFPDDAPDLEHKTMLWDPKRNRYATGPKREDTLVLKWAMDADTVDLTVHADQEYKADVWYWKACRTDPAGYADDKLQVYSTAKLASSKPMISRSGRMYYLSRSGDSGEAAYRLVLRASYEGDSVAKFQVGKPTGSRADIRAKGEWRGGSWTVEFARALRTGHPDDVQLDPARSYVLGVSRYEIAGREPDPSLDQPLFGAGDVGEHLRLRFAPAP